MAQTHRPKNQGVSLCFQLFFPVLAQSAVFFFRLHRLRALDLPGVFVSFSFGPLDEGVFSFAFALSLLFLADDDMVASSMYLDL